MIFRISSPEFLFTLFGAAIVERVDGIVLILPALSEFGGAAHQSLGDCLGLLLKPAGLDGLHGGTKFSGLPAGTGGLCVGNFKTSRSYVLEDRGRGLTLLEECLIDQSSPVGRVAGNLQVRLAGGEEVGQIC